MPEITEQQLSEILVGIAKTQAAIIQAFCNNDLKSLSSVQNKIEAIIGRNRPNPKPITFSSLPAKLCLKALSTPGPNAPDINQEAYQEVCKLFRKSSEL